MSCEEFPDTLYRVRLNAESPPHFRVEVLEIPCKRTAKAFKTANGRLIKHDALMEPDSIYQPGMLIEHIYCQEDQIQAAVGLLVCRARKRADESLARAQAIHATVNSEPIVTHKCWPD